MQAILQFKIRSKRWGEPHAVVNYLQAFGLYWKYHEIIRKSCVAAGRMETPMWLWYRDKAVLFQRTPHLPWSAAADWQL